MLVKTSSKRCRTDNLEWLLDEIGVKDISKVQGLSVSEFIEKYSQKHFSNICLDRLLEMGYVYVTEGEKLVAELPITTRLKIFYYEMMCTYCPILLNIPERVL